MVEKDLSLNIESKNKKSLKTLGKLAIPFVAGVTAYFVADRLSLNAPLVAYLAFGIPAVCIKEMIDYKPKTS